MKYTITNSVSRLSIIILFLSIGFAQNQDTTCTIPPPRKNIEVLENTFKRKGENFQAIFKIITSLDNIQDGSFPYANFHLVYMPNINLARKAFYGASVISSNLIYADLEKSDARKADFTLSNLCGVNLHKAGLSGASFSNTNLSNSDLSFANLSGVDLSFANLKNANLEGAFLVNSIVDTSKLTYEQLSQVGSLYRTVFVKPHTSSLMGPMFPFIIDEETPSKLKESHPKLFNEVPLEVWFVPSQSQYYPEYIWNYVEKNIIFPVETNQ